MIIDVETIDSGTTASPKSKDNNATIFFVGQNGELLKSIGKYNYRFT